MTWVDTVVVYILAILVIICAYGIGYFKAKMKDSEIIFEIVDKLQAKLRTYTGETYDKEAQAFFHGALWVICTYRELDEWKGEDHEA